MNGLSSLLDFTRPATWLIASVAAAIVVTNLAWWVTQRSQLTRASGWQAAGWLGVALFSILPALFAWQAGALSPFHLGLSGLDWIPTLMLGAPLVALIITTLLAGWLAYRRTLPPPADAVDRSRDRIAAAVRAPLDAVLRQWHWAFYRALAIAWIATWAPQGGHFSRILNIDPATDSLYWGSWLGLLFLAAEWALNPFARAALYSKNAGAAATILRADAQETAVRQVALAVATTALFALTRNLWLCLVCHIAVETVVVGWLALPGRESRPTQAHTDP